MDWLLMCWGVFVVCGAYLFLDGAYAFVNSVYGVFGGRAGSRQYGHGEDLNLPSRAWHPPPTAWGCHRGLSQIFARIFCDRRGRLPADPLSPLRRKESLAVDDLLMLNTPSTKSIWGYFF